MILNENSSFVVGSQTRSMEIIFQPFLGENNKLFGYNFSWLSEHFWRKSQLLFLLFSNICYQIQIQPVEEDNQ